MKIQKATSNMFRILFYMSFCVSLPKAKKPTSIYRYMHIKSELLNYTPKVKKAHIYHTEAHRN